MMFSTDWYYLSVAVGEHGHTPLGLSREGSFQNVTGASQLIRHMVISPKPPQGLTPHPVFPERKPDVY